MHRSERISEIEKQSRLSVRRDWERTGKVKLFSVENWLRQIAVTNYFNLI